MATWYETFDDETKGYITSRGLDKKTAEEAVVETIKSHRNAEAKLGVPSDKLVKLPEPDDAEGTKALWQKLGVPKEASEYDFSTVARTDGKEVDPTLLDLIRGVAAETGMTKAAAAAMASRLVKGHEQDEATRTTKDKADVALAHQALTNAWGANFDTNKFIADRAAALLGMSPEQLNAAANATSYPVLMDGLRKIGVAMGEGKLLGVGTGGGSTSSAMTREEAVSEIRSLRDDKDFVKRWAAGGKTERETLERLTKLSVGPAINR